MTYNKAKEEKKWRIWKEDEESILRELGVENDIIEQLRLYDWTVFNCDRRYYEKIQETSTYLEELAASSIQTEIKSIKDLLDSIEDEKLYHILRSMDKLTLQVVLLKIQGFTYREIALKLGITDKSVYRRMDRLKEKLKNINLRGEL